MADPSPLELKWRQYELLVNMYRFYLELFLKFNVFLYAVTGAIVSVYLTKLNEPVMRFALLLPVVMNLFFGLVFVYGATRIEVSQKEVKEICGALELSTYPAFRVLTVVLSLGAVLLFLIAAGLLAVVLRCVSLS
jgi:hypothetical protein